MFVQLIDNLGSNDAEPLGLNFRECLKGATLEVAEAVGEKLLRKRLAVEVERPKTIRAIPPAPAIGKAKSEQGSIERATEELAERQKKATPPAPTLAPPTPEAFSQNPHKQTK